MINKLRIAGIFVAAVMAFFTVLCMSAYCGETEEHAALDLEAVHVDLGVGKTATGSVDLEDVTIRYSLSLRDVYGSDGNNCNLLSIGFDVSSDHQVLSGLVETFGGSQMDGIRVDSNGSMETVRSGLIGGIQYGDDDDLTLHRGSGFLVQYGSGSDVGSCHETFGQEFLFLMFDEKCSLKLDSFFGLLGEDVHTVIHQPFKLDLTTV